jgi:hypothetical protein
MIVILECIRLLPGPIDVNSTHIIIRGIAVPVGALGLL